MDEKRKVKRFRWMLAVFSTVMILDVLFDLGKWGLGRYTVVTPIMSVTMIVAFSAILALIVEFLHRKRSIQEKRYEQYLHHKTRVYVEKSQKGKHWDASICPACEHFQPDSEDNCLIESTVHIMNRDNNLVCVVWECPGFKKKKRKRKC